VGRHIRDDKDIYRGTAPSLRPVPFSLPPIPARAVDGSPPSPPFLLPRRHRRIVVQKPRRQTRSIMGAAPSAGRLVRRCCSRRGTVLSPPARYRRPICWWQDRYTCPPRTSAHQLRMRDGPNQREQKEKKRWG
jgi:hypothetical protein